MSTNKEEILKVGDKTIVVETKGSEVEEKPIIPEDWTFNFDSKSGSITHNGLSIPVKLPNIADMIAIEARKSILARGQYSAMAVSFVNTQITAVNLLDAVSTIQVVCTLPEKFPHKDNLIEAGEEQIEDILTVYENYLNWKKFFRSQLEGRKSKNS